VVPYLVPWNRKINIDYMQPRSCCFTYYKKSYQKLHTFRRSITVHNFSNLHYVALVSLSPHTFVGPPFCFYQS
jgi:hypothetical protein